MSRHAQALDVFALQLEVGIDHVVGEDAALGQELTIAVQRGQGLFEALGHGRDGLGFFGRQVVEVLVHRVARVDLVLDTVDTGHQHRGERQVRVGRRIRETRLDTLAFRAGGVRDTDGSGTVAGRVGQHDRRFEARHQTLVGVGGRIGEGVQGTSVLDDAANVVEGHFGQTRVLVTGELVVAILPEGLVNVHAGTVVTDQRLGHEGRGLAVGVSHVVDHVLEFLNLIGLLDQGVELDADLVLAGVRHFVVVNFDFLTDGFQGVAHGSTDIVEAVDRRDREVAALQTRTVTQVAAFRRGIGRPGTFFGRDLEHGTVHLVLPVHFVEDEEFRLRTEEGGVAQTGGLQEFLGTLGDGTRVALIALHGGRLDDVTAQHQGGVFGERVEEGSAVVRHQDHVGFVDALPTFDGGTIEHLAVLEEFLIHCTRRDGDVLLLALGVGEAQINPLDFVFFNQGKCLLSHGNSPMEPAALVTVGVSVVWGYCSIL